MFRKAAPQKQDHIPLVSSLDTVGGIFNKGPAGEGLDEYRGWVYACVRAISEKVSTLELTLNQRMTDGTTEPVTEHPVLDLLRDVNPFMTWRDLLVTTQSYLELEGTAPWWVYRPKAGGPPEAIWPIRPDHVSVIPDPVKVLAGFVYKLGNQTIKIDPENMVLIKEFNPKELFKGLGTTYAAASAINADNYARDWNRDFFKNGARVDGIIYKDGNMTQAEYKEIKDKWRDQYQGLGKSHRTAVLGGGLKYEAMGMSQADMDFVNLRTFSRDEILALYRVPKTVLGVTDGTATRATAETTEYVFMKETIKPKMQKLVEILNEYILPMYGIDTDEMFFTFTDPVPQNQELALQKYANGLVNGWMSPNEVRSLEGLPPVENGDAVMTTFSAVPLGEPVKSVRRIAPKSKMLIQGSLVQWLRAPRQSVSPLAAPFISS